MFLPRSLQKVGYGSGFSAFFGGSRKLKSPAVPEILNRCFSSFLLLFSVLQRTGSRFTLSRARSRDSMQIYSIRGLDIRVTRAGIVPSTSHNGLAMSKQ